MTRGGVDGGVDGGAVAVAAADDDLAVIVVTTAVVTIGCHGAAVSCRGGACVALTEKTFYLPERAASPPIHERIFTYHQSSNPLATFRCRSQSLSFLETS